MTLAARRDLLRGGGLGPLALMFGLTRTSGSTASRLLNLETVLTAVIAWVVFKENADRRIVLGMLAIVAGGVVLSWLGGDGAASDGLGLLGYGISLVLFVLALHGLGTARTGADFSTAPFIGAAVSLVLLGESTSAAFWLAAALMAWGVWLHLTEHHEHEHVHEALAHKHPHFPDIHHRHSH